MTLVDDLKTLGWDPRSHDEIKTSIQQFQRGWNLGPRLTEDGIAGDHTLAAIRASVDRLHRGQSTASPHFSFSEWQCGCKGVEVGCLVVCVHRSLLAGLELYRDAAKGPVVIASGYRCHGHNRKVGGASDSQHLYGGAADVGYSLSDRQVASLHVFSGIGRSHRTHLVRHVDVRHVTGHDSTGGTTGRPTIWDYPN